MTAKEYAAALRQVADWYEAHPDAPQPEPKLVVTAIHGKEELARFARALGHSRKSSDAVFFRVSRDFGGITLEGIEYRSNICERVVVGTRLVAERIEPAPEEEIIPEHEEEIVEWRCPESLLEAEAGEQARGEGEEWDRL